MLDTKADQVTRHHGLYGVKSASVRLISSLTYHNEYAQNMVSPCWECLSSPFSLFLPFRRGSGEPFLSSFRNVEWMTITLSWGHWSLFLRYFCDWLIFFFALGLQIGSGLFWQSEMFAKEMKRTKSISAKWIQLKYPLTLSSSKLFLSHLHLFCVSLFNISHCISFPAH